MKESQYLTEVKKALQAYDKAHTELLCQWMDAPQEIKIDDILNVDYPFNICFNDLLPAVRNWKQRTTELIDKRIEELKTPFKSYIDEFVVGDDAKMPLEALDTYAPQFESDDVVKAYMCRETKFTFVELKDGQFYGLYCNMDELGTKEQVLNFFKENF